MKVIVLRGLPGAGKSTWIAQNVPNAVVCSADHFMIEDGVYRWAATKLGSAHLACQQKFELALKNKEELVVVDNCNLTNRDMKFYVETAEQYGYDIEIRTLHVDPQVAAARQVHGVPAEKYRLLVERLTMPLRPDWQKYEVVEDDWKRFARENEKKILTAFRLDPKDLKGGF